MAGNELYTWIFQQFTFKKKKKDNSILKFIDSFLLTFSTDHTVYCVMHNKIYHDP